MDGMKQRYWAQPEPLYLITAENFQEICTGIITAANRPTYSCCDRLIAAQKEFARRFYGHLHRRNQ